MDNRVAMMNIIAEDISAIEDINNVIHEYRENVLGRLGMPYRPKHVNIIVSIALEAPKEVITEISDRLNEIDGVKVQTAFSK